MGRLESVSMEELHELLVEVDEGTPTQRILAAIAYKQGDSKTRLAERHDVRWKTVDSWLNRFAEQPIEHAPYDEQRSGRPPKLTEDQRDVLFENLDKSPEEFGYDRQAWFPTIVYHHVKEKFGVEYSLRHIRRLMEEAGLSWRTARPRHHEADPELQTEFEETVEKKRQELSEQDKTVVVVDQFSKYVETVRQRGWHPIGSNPTVEVMKPYEKVTVLGAVTEDGDSFYCWTEESLTADHGIRLLEALVNEFGEDLVVFLDRARYFYAKDLWEHVSGKRETETVGDSSVSCVRGNTLDVWYFPPKSPELNPMEGCWRQVTDWFNYRLIKDLDELKQSLGEAISEIHEPTLWNYLCP